MKSEFPVMKCLNSDSSLHVHYNEMIFSLMRLGNSISFQAADLIPQG